MARRTGLRLVMAVVLLAGEPLAAISLVTAVPVPARAQFFDNGFPFQNNGFPLQNRRQREPFGWFEPAPAPRPIRFHRRAALQQSQQERPASPVDDSRAPAPKKTDSKAEPASTPIMVLGDAMADWLAYGLEIAYADSHEIGIVRQARTNSGLIRAQLHNDQSHNDQVYNDPQYPDWPQAAREMIAAQNPRFVVMMVGINDRKQIREQVSPQRGVKPAPEPAGKALIGHDTPAPAGPETPAATAPETTVPGGNRAVEFRTDAWSEAYIRRIDETIASLKTSKVPVFWVGLPPLRGEKSASDIPFLNELYRSRADKAGVVYIDIWDGFVDEDGRYVQSGPDVDGQTRRLRTNDGVYFTNAGARKLAHYVEREIERWISARAAPVARSIPQEPQGTKVEESARVGQSGLRARPLSGPTMPLMSESGARADELLGGNARQPVADALATKVLARGEAVPVPAGRADDFAWPRRDVAPVGSDPVVATTDLPMTPMVADRKGIDIATTAAAPPTKAASSATVASAAPPKPAALRRVRRSSAYAQAPLQSPYRPDYRWPSAMFQSYGFQPLFGGYR
jgi:uncharacterized protein